MTLADTMPSAWHTPLSHLGVGFFTTPGFPEPQTPVVHMPSPLSSLISQPALQHSAHTISHPSSSSVLQPLKITAKQVLYKHHLRSHKSPPGNLTEVLTLLAW